MSAVVIDGITHDSMVAQSILPGSQSMPCIALRA